jgi:carbonic anhydrase
MRNLIALLACCLVIATAHARIPQAHGDEHGAAPAKTDLKADLKAKADAEAKAVAKADGKSESDVVAPVKAKPAALSPAAQRAREDDAESELSAKIAARLAAMKANQAARVAAAAKARKAAEAKQKQAAIVAAIPPPPRHGSHWSYEGEEGPANWASVNVDWAKCGTGNRQSPIDIRDGMKVDLEQIVFDYNPASFSVVDNGHTIQVSVNGGNYITVQNRTYELLQFHFHRPSEERINGKGFEMVVHLVHKDAEGKLAVVAVLLERGKAHNLIQTVWNNLPLEKGDVINPSVVLDMKEILPKRRDYYTYMGSLTTPPCTEGVLWLVMKEPVQASPAQMALFSRLYPLNARPIQSGSGRVIKESN